MKTLLFQLSLALAGGSLPALAARATESAVKVEHGRGSFVETSSGSIYYEVTGKGPVLILVAGGPGASHSSFHRWFERLADTHTVVFFDNIGRGRSKPANAVHHSVERDAADIEALRRHLGLETFDLLGHSYGGIPAMEYAATYPDRVSHLVLSDTLYGGSSWQQNIDSMNWLAENQFPEVWSDLVAMRERGMATSAESYSSRYGDAVGDAYWYNPDAAKDMFKSGDPADGFATDIYLSMLGADPEWKVGGPLADYDGRSRLQRIRVPTLVAVGRFDRVATPRIAREMAGILAPDIVRFEVFERSGHRPWVEEPDRYFSILRAFLEGDHVVAPRP